jgi:Flp pilus assembly protein TadD
MNRGIVSILPRAAAVAALVALAGCAGDADLTVDGTTRSRLAQALEASGDPTNAAAVLRGQDGATNIAPAMRGDDPTFALKVAALAVRAGRLTEADEIYQQLLVRHPESVEALNGRGVVLAQRGDLQDAAGAFRQALELRPQDLPARNNLDLVRALTAPADRASQAPDHENRVADAAAHAKPVPAAKP